MQEILTSQGQALQTYLDDRISLLQQYAQFPLFTDTVMNPDQYKADLADFIHDLYYLEQDEHFLTLFDFVGDKIYSEQEDVALNIAEVAWFSEIMNQEQPYYVGGQQNNQDENGRYFWVIAVPIVYNDYPEGVLVAQFPATLTFLLKDRELSGYQVELHINTLIVASAGTMGEMYQEKVYGLTYPGITLRLRTDNSETVQARKLLMRNILLILAIGSLVAIIVFYRIGQTLFVQPHQQLELVSHELQSNNRDLQNIVTQVISVADEVTSLSQAMRVRSADMSQGATEQAAAVEEASSSMEQMASNIRQNANNAVQTEKIALEAAEHGIQSEQAVTDVVEAMRKIANNIAIIDDISRQTRMLSLNATIEAARAQEHGRGFAVVASEVRALAEGSQKAATEIIHLVNSGSILAEQAGNMLVKLVPDIRKTADLMQEISAATREQDTGAMQINNAIQQLDRVTQQNTSVSEELSETAEKLASHAEQLQRIVIQFKQTESDEST
ncbi:MAG: hypothetical protein GY799_12575 [Desulfobulbaceae bacterium]|nr:hypothetical protein [Desulfobulbaceae bacterium]